MLQIIASSFSDAAATYQLLDRSFFSTPSSHMHRRGSCRGVPDVGVSRGSFESFHDLLLYGHYVSRSFR